MDTHAHEIVEEFVNREPQEQDFSDSGELGQDTLGAIEHEQDTLGAAELEQDVSDAVEHDFDILNASDQEQYQSDGVVKGNNEDFEDEQYSPDTWKTVDTPVKTMDKHSSQQRKPKRTPKKTPSPKRVASPKKIEPTTVQNRRRKSKTLLEPTESMINAMKDREKRKGEIKPEDDPFWEKRGGKGADTMPRYEEVPARPPKPIKEALKTLQPVDKSSHFLATTKAAASATYHKVEPKKELKVAPLSPTSHLLTPTRASVAATFTPPPAEEPPRAKSPQRSASPLRESSRLYDLTTARKISARDKVVSHQPEANPREVGWNEFFARSGQRRRSGAAIPSPSAVTPNGGRASTSSTPGEAVPNPAPPEKPYNNPYKDVKSKLYNPTVASVRQMWMPGSEDVESNDAEMDPAAAEAEADEQRRRSSGSSYGHVNSRLLEPTASVRSSMWCNRPDSPEQLARSSSPMRADAAEPPSFHNKPTTAHIHNQREKFVKHDPKDVGAGSRQRRGSTEKFTPPAHARLGRISYYAPVIAVSRSQSSFDEFDGEEESAVGSAAGRDEVARLFQNTDSFSEAVNPMVAEMEEEDSSADSSDQEGEKEDMSGAGSSPEEESVPVVEDAQESQEREQVEGEVGGGGNDSAEGAIADEEKTAPAEEEEEEADTRNADEESVAVEDVQVQLEEAGDGEKDEGEEGEVETDTGEEGGEEVVAGADQMVAEGGPPTVDQEASAHSEIEEAEAEDSTWTDVRGSESGVEEVTEGITRVGVLTEKGDRENERSGDDEDAPALSEADVESVTEAIRQRGASEEEGGAEDLIA